MGWYYVAGKVEESIAQLKENLFRKGQAIDCDDQVLSGFPFRISVTCSKSGFRDPGSGFSIDAGEVRTASQVYQPGKVVMEIDGPAILHPPFGDALDLDWASMRASVFADLSGLDRFSLSGKQFSFSPRDPSIDQFQAAELQAHGRKIQANDMDIAVVSQQVVSSQNRWPEFGLIANIRVKDAFDKLLRNPDLRKLGRETGLQGKVNEIKYRLLGGGEVKISGPYEVSTDGLLSGTFDVEAQRITKLVEGLEKALPQNRDIFRQIGQAAALLGGDDGRGSVTFKVSVRNGNAALGLIPIGKVPPLY